MLSTDPLDLLLDTTTHDLVVTDDIAFSSGLSGVAQAIKIAVQMIRGEWFADLREGIPYFERDGVTAREALLGQKVNIPRAVSEFRTVITSVIGVASVQDVRISYSAARTLSLSWQVTTVFGDTVADKLVIA